jgi:sulfur carrier protein ThiS
MKVEVQLTGGLAARLADRRMPGVIDVADGITLAELLRDLGVPELLACLTLVNGQDATRAQVLRAGDVVALFPPLQGGRRIARDAPSRQGRTS